MPRSLFDPVALGRISLPNRFVRSATWEGMCDQQGAPTDRLIHCYRRLAKEGVGLIISGYSFVSKDGKQLPGKMGLHDDTLIPSLRELTNAVHQEGGLVFCQLVHAGGQTSSKVIGTTPIAPSAIAFPSYGETPREMTQGDIRAVIEAFSESARRARDAGFDGIQLHGAHGYLINQFLSPLMNQRQDLYGGSLDNRMRFLLDVYAAVRKAVGTDYPVTIKLTASDNLPGGFAMDEALSTALKLQEAGMDAIEISSGTSASGDKSPVRQKIDSEETEGYNASFAHMIKKNLHIPVMVVGGLRSCAVMQRLLWEGSADLFALSRPFIREPDLVNHWRRDNSHRATCISCNGCFKPGIKEGGIYCVVNRIESRNSAPVI